MIITNSTTNTVSANERALLYGDGCFTTMAVSNGHVELWHLHLARLQNSCKHLGIQFDEWQLLGDKTFDIAKHNPNAVIKILISRGEGGRGYDPTGVLNCKAIISIHDKPSHYLSWQQNGVELSLSDITLARQPLLAGIKHLNRLEQVLIKQNMVGFACDDVVVCDTMGSIIETSVGNLFWRKNHSWFTPKLDNCGVDGVMRNFLFEYFKENNIQLNQIDSDIDELIGADEIFMCNSLMKVVPVSRFVTKTLQKDVSFSMTSHIHIQQWLNQSIPKHYAN